MSDDTGICWCGHRLTSFVHDDKEERSHVFKKRTPLMELAVEAYAAWHEVALDPAGREADGARCPGCYVKAGQQHLIPCPVDRGVWPCLSWKPQPGFCADTCECGATRGQHERTRGDTDGRLFINGAGASPMR